MEVTKEFKAIVEEIRTKYPMIREHELLMAGQITLVLTATAIKAGVAEKDNVRVMCPSQGLDVPLLEILEMFGDSLKEILSMYLTFVALEHGVENVEGAMEILVPRLRNMEMQATQEMIAAAGSAFDMIERIRQQSKLH